MSLIAKDDLATLIPAASAKTVAANALLDQDKMSAAYAINTAANSGRYNVIWQHELSEDLKSTLEGQGYTVETKTTGSGTPYLYLISWS